MVHNFQCSNSAVKPDVNKNDIKKFGIVPIPLPEIPNDKSLGRFIFQFGGSDTYGSSCKVLKFSGEDWDFANMRSTDPEFADILANPDKHDATDAPILYELSSIGKEYRNFADITTYAKECIENGQKKMYVIVGCWNSTINMRLNISWTTGGYPTADLYQSYFYILEELGSLEMVSSSHKDGDFLPDVDTGISFKFSNKIAALNKFLRIYYSRVKEIYSNS